MRFERANYVRFERANVGNGRLFCRLFCRRRVAVQDDVQRAVLTPLLSQSRGDLEEEGAEEESGPLYRLERMLDPWVAYLILPVFALLNAGVSLSGSGGGVLFGPVALGVMAGLLLGKPAGVLGLTFLATRPGWATLPQGVGWGAMVGLGFLAGIGFTVALFIATLAFEEGGLVDQAKIGTLTASVFAAGLGLALLRLWAR